MYTQLQVRASEDAFEHSRKLSSECVSAQVNVVSVISQGFDYKPEEVLYSQAVRKAAPAPEQAPQLFFPLTTVPVSTERDNSAGTPIIYTP